jgi:hypothetical protein
MNNRVYANMVNSKLVHRIIGGFHNFYAKGLNQPLNRTKKRTLICLRVVDRKSRFAFMNQLGYRDMHVITLENNANENIFNSLVGFRRMYRDPIIHPTVITGIYLQEMTRASSELNALIESLHK